jgi:hypothetical protein
MRSRSDSEEESLLKFLEDLNRLFETEGVKWEGEGNLKFSDFDESTFSTDDCSTSTNKKNIFEPKLSMDMFKEKQETFLQRLKNRASNRKCYPDNLNRLIDGCYIKTTFLNLNSKSSKSPHFKQ